MKSLLSFLSGAAFVAMQLSAPASQVQAGDDRVVPTFRSSSRLVSIFVVAIDRNGNYVHGLHQDDLQIFDNGKLEKIAFFSLARDAKSEPNVVPSLAAEDYTNNPKRRGATDQNAILILFDTINTGYMSQAYSLGKIRRFLRQLQPEDRVGIYVLTSKGLKVAYDLTQPAVGLLEAMRRYDESHNRPGTQKSLTVEGSSFTKLDRFLRGRDNRQPPRRCDAGNFELTISAFQQIARSITGFHGRKAVVWVTEKMPLPIAEENAFDIARSKFCGMQSDDPDLLVEDHSQLRPLQESPARGYVTPHLHDDSGTSRANVADRGLTENDELDLTLRLMTQNNIALYPVSAEGLQTVRLFGSSGMDSTVSVVADPSAITNGVLTAEKAVSNQESHQAMERLARRTGGRALYDRNDIDVGIRRALDDAKYGYEVSYYPGHGQWNGDWHKIEVRVNRPGVVVHGRTGYYAFPEARLLPPKASRQLLTEIAASPLEDTEIPVTVKMPLSAKEHPSVMEPRIYLDATDVFHSQTPGGWKCNFEILFFQLTAANAILDVTTQSANLDLTDVSYSQALKHGINTSQRLDVKPGAALLYVIVHDKTSDSAGSIRIPLDLPMAKPETAEFSH